MKIKIEKAHRASLAGWRIGPVAKKQAHGRVIGRLKSKGIVVLPGDTTVDVTGITRDLRSKRKGLTVRQALERNNAVVARG